MAIPMSCRTRLYQEVLAGSILRQGIRHAGGERQAHIVCYAGLGGSHALIGC